MLNPAIGKLIRDRENRYGLVMEVAKRARKASHDAEERGEILIEKPVSIAIDQLAAELKD